MSWRRPVVPRLAGKGTPARFRTRSPAIDVAQECCQSSPASRWYGTWGSWRRAPTTVSIAAASVPRRAQPHDGAAHVLDPRLRSARGRVGRAQHARGEDHVVADDVDDLGEIELRRAGHGREAAERQRQRAQVRHGAHQLVDLDLAHAHHLLITDRSPREVPDGTFGRSPGTKDLRGGTLRACAAGRGRQESGNSRNRRNGRNRLNGRISRYGRRSTRVPRPTPPASRSCGWTGRPATPSPRSCSTGPRS